MRARRSPRTLLAATLGATLVSVVGLIAMAGTAEAAVIVVQAESYAAQSGVQLEPTADTGGGQNASYLANGDWMRFDGVDLGAAGALPVAVRVASAVGSGAVELRTGSLTGPVLAQFAINPTGGWQNWVTLSATANTHPTGAQTVFAVLRSTGGGDFVNLNWLSFGAGDPAGGAGWVVMDRAKWNAQLAAFNALVPRPVPANSVRVPEFNASCL
jgi:hypothetical protein